MIQKWIFTIFFALEENFERLNGYTLGEMMAFKIIQNTYLHSSTYSFQEVF